MSELEVCEKQNEIIKMQSDIIDDLYIQLMQYVAIEDEERELTMIKEAATMQEELREQR